MLATDVLAAVLFLNAAVALLGAYTSVNPRMHTSFFWCITYPSAHAPHHTTAPQSEAMIEVPTTLGLAARTERTTGR